MQYNNLELNWLEEHGHLLEDWPESIPKIISECSDRLIPIPIRLTILTHYLKFGSGGFEMNILGDEIGIKLIGLNAEGYYTIPDFISVLVFNDGRRPNSFEGYEERCRAEALNALSRRDLPKNIIKDIAKNCGWNVPLKG